MSSGLIYLLLYLQLADEARKQMNKRFIEKKEILNLFYCTCQKPPQEGSRWWEEHSLPGSYLLLRHDPDCGKSTLNNCLQPPSHEGSKLWLAPTAYLITASSSDTIQLVVTALALPVYSLLLRDDPDCGYSILITYLYSFFRHNPDGS